MTDLELKKFNLVVEVMKEGGYTLSTLTEFLIKGLGNASRAGVSHEGLRPDPSLVQIRVLESLASLHKTPRPRRQPVSPRGKKRMKQKAEASLDTVPVSIPQAPQSEVGAELGKKKQEIAKTPSAGLSIALAPPAADSMPRGKKRKELASEIDELAEEFATRLNLGNESKAPSPKRLKRNASLPREARITQLEKITSGSISRDTGKKPPQKQQQQSPPPLEQQQQQRKATVQLQKREETIAKARARREIIR